MQTIDVVALARRIPEARIGHGLTQHDLARETDMHVNHIRNIEQGRANFANEKTVSRIKTIAEHLDMKMPRLKNGADHYRGTGQERQEPSILETHVGPKEVSIAPAFDDKDVGPQNSGGLRSTATNPSAALEIAPSIIDEPAPKSKPTPWRATPEFAEDQEGEPAPDLELVVMGEGNRQLERLSDPKARRRVLLYWMDRYVRTDSPHLLEGDE